jgi:hypothetical protein
MTVDELKAQFCCTDDRCVHARPFRDIFIMLHTIGRMIEKMTPERLEQTLVLVNEIIKRSEARALTQMLATGIDLEKMGIVTVANAIAGFSLLVDQAIVHEMAREFTDSLENKAPKCSGLIQ